METPSSQDREMTETVIYKAPEQLTRRCGECNLCCKLLPMQSGNRAEVSRTMNAMIFRGLASPADFAGMIEDFYKPPGERCPHQRRSKGCAVYKQRPFGCRMWSCRWLLNADTADLRRPDRVHYVIDCMPDYIIWQNDATGERTNIEVVQIWVDPDYRNEWKHDPALTAFIQRRAKEGIAALIRYNSKEADSVFAPEISADQKWHVVSGMAREDQHTAEELHAALRKANHNVKIAEGVK